MSLESLKKIQIRKAKRVGRGPGSGKGKTSGKGTKGQNARGKMPITHSHFEGGQRPLFKRLPYRRGKGNKSLSKKPIALSLELLNKLPKGAVVTIALLVENKIIDKNDAKRLGVKFLASTKFQNTLTLSLPVSKSAALQVEKAGGKVEPYQFVKTHSAKNPSEIEPKVKSSKVSKSK